MGLALLAGPWGHFRCLGASSAVLCRAPATLSSLENSATPSLTFIVSSHAGLTQSAVASYSSSRPTVQFESRKPAIKKPARHQWFYCAKDYDPMEPPPAQPLPPYAPAKARQKDYFQAYFQVRPKFQRGRSVTWLTSWAFRTGNYFVKGLSLQRQKVSAGAHSRA